LWQEFLFNLPQNTIAGKKVEKEKKNKRVIRNKRARDKSIHKEIDSRTLQ
jgi:hypothetical protein